jgi:hypothetical protein
MGGVATSWAEVAQLLSIALLREVQRSPPYVPPFGGTLGYLVDSDETHAPAGTGTGIEAEAVAAVGGATAHFEYRSTEERNRAQFTMH